MSRLPRSSSFSKLSSDSGWLNSVITMSSFVHVLVRLGLGGFRLLVAFFIHYLCEVIAFVPEAASDPSLAHFTCFVFISFCGFEILVARDVPPRAFSALVRARFRSSVEISHAARFASSCRKPEGTFCCFFPYQDVVSTFFPCRLSFIPRSMSFNARTSV